MCKRCLYGSLFIIPSQLTLTLFSESCPDSNYRRASSYLFFPHKDKIIWLYLGGKNESCSKRGWGYLAERAKALETNRSGTPLCLRPLLLRTCPWTSCLTCLSLNFFICKDEGLLWRLRSTTCQTPQRVPIAYYQEMLSRWSSASPLHPLSMQPWGPSAHAGSQLSITVTHITLFPSGLPLFSSWKLF